MQETGFNLLVSALILLAVWALVEGVLKVCDGVRRIVARVRDYREAQRSWNERGK